MSMGLGAVTSRTFPRDVKRGRH